MRRLGPAWLVGVALVLGSCGGSPKQTTRSTSDLRLAVGTDPRNLDARLALAHRAHSEGRPGEALREFLFVAERRELSGKDRERLSELLLARGSARLKARDAGALPDFVKGRRAGGAVQDAALREARVLCVLASWRHSSRFRHPRGQKCLAELPEDHVLHKHQEISALSTHEALALWDLWDGARAKRQALKVAERYVESGGREPSRLLEWRALHRWWFGDRRPLLPVSAARMMPAEEPATERLAKALVEPPRATAATLAEDWALEGEEAELAQILADHRLSPARAERRVRRWVDGEVYPIRRLLVASELFYRLGSVELARIWAQELVDLAPQLPAAQEAAGLAHMAAGQVDRGELFITHAAAASGDAGATWSRATYALWHIREPLRAIGAGKRAQTLTARGWDLGLLYTIARAQRALGRHDDAEHTLQALWERIPLADRKEAREQVRAALERGEALRNEQGPETVVSLFGPIRGQFGIR